jgi:hypothetical protein
VSSDGKRMASPSAGIIGQHRVCGELPGDACKGEGPETGPKEYFSIATL